MKIIRNKHIPFQGFKAMNLFGILFVRGNAIINERTIEHESVHSKQLLEVALIFSPLLFLSLWYILLLPCMFYIWYVVEFLIRLIFTRDWDKAYKAISFEREAYSGREKRFGWIKRIK